MEHRPSAGGGSRRRGGGRSHRPRGEPRSGGRQRCPSPDGSPATGGSRPPIASPNGDRRPAQAGWSVGGGQGPRSPSEASGQPRRIPATPGREAAAVATPMEGAAVQGFEVVARSQSGDRPRVADPLEPPAAKGKEHRGGAATAASRVARQRGASAARQGEHGVHGGTPGATRRREVP